MTVRRSFAFIVSKKLLLYLVIYIVLLSLPVLIKYINIEVVVPEILVPPISVLALWALPLLVLYRVRSPLTQIFAVLWILWFAVGSFNLSASYRYYGDLYLLDAQRPAFIYIVFLLALISGMYFYEKVLNKVRLKKRRTRDLYEFKSLSPIFANLLLIFPFIWFGSLMWSVGYIPVLKALLEGENIVLSMYSLSYSRVYGFAIINALSFVVAVGKFFGCKGSIRYVYLLLCVIFFGFMFASGKRHWMLLSLLSALVFLFRLHYVSVRQVILFLALGAGLYVSLEIVRRGTDIAAFSGFWGKLFTIGHEYRTFSYVVNHFEPGEIENYDFAISSIAAAINSTVLRAFGLNKTEIIQLSSAYSWRYIFYSDFGIRAGIIAELYMAYGFGGAFLLFIFGIIVAWLNSHIEHGKSKDNLLFLSVIISLCMFTLVDSMNDFTGSLTVIFYVWMAYLATRVLTQKTYISFPAT